MTESRLKRRKVSGQSEAEDTHTYVGKQVREIVKDNTGHYPEQFPQDPLPILKVEVYVKQVGEGFKKQDKEMSGLSFLTYVGLMPL